MKAGNEAISYITAWIPWVLAIIPISAGFIITYFSVRKSLSADEGEIGEYNKKIKQTIKGAIIAFTLGSFITVVKVYYK